MIRCVVIIEDDFLSAIYLEGVCQRLGYPVAGTAASADAGMELIRRIMPDCLLVDVRLIGGRDGIDLAGQVRRELPDIKIIFVTGSDEPSTMIRIKATSPDGILIKPTDAAQLRACLKEIDA